MFDFFIQSGAFMIGLLILSVFNIFISIKYIIVLNNIISIVLLCILCTLLRIFATYIGINGPLSLESDLSKVTSHNLLNGIKTSLFASIIGGIIMFISNALWYLFIDRHTLFIV